MAKTKAGKRGKTKAKSRKPTRTQKWARKASEAAKGRGKAKAASKPKAPKVRQGVIAGTLDEHDVKLCRAAEDYRQAEGALEDARTEFNESSAHLIGLMRRKQKVSYTDPDGTKITIKEIAARMKIKVDKVIPRREIPNPTPKPEAKAEPRTAEKPKATATKAEGGNGKVGSTHTHETREIPPVTQTAPADAPAQTTTAPATSPG